MLQWTIGKVTVTSVAELGDIALPGTTIIPDATPDAILGVDWLRPRFADAAGNTKMRPLIDWWHMLAPIFIVGSGIDQFLNKDSRRKFAKIRSKGPKH